MASVKLEVGKFYQTRDGQKVGPIRLHNSASDMPYDARDFAEDGKYYGTCFFYSEDGQANGSRGNDLIAEWTDEATSPIRTVTRKEVVPGVYGAVIVEWHGLYEVSVTVSHVYGAEEIRAAIATMTEIADTLEENQ